MVEFARGPNGEYAVKQPGLGWEMVDGETYAQYKKSGAGRFFGALGDAVQDAVGSTLDAATPFALRPGGWSDKGLYDPRAMVEARERGETTLGERIMAQNDPRQAARAYVDPGMSSLGEWAELGLELAVPGGSVTAPGRAVSNGVQRGVQTGEAIVNRSRSRAPVPANRGTTGTGGTVIPEGGGPPGSITGVQPDAMRQAANKGFGNRISGMWDRNPDEAFNAKADAQGFRLTPGVRQNSDGMRQMEAAWESRPGGAAAFRPIREHNNKNLREKIVRGLGGTGDDLGPEARGVLKDNLGQKFDDFSKQAGNVPLTPTKARLQNHLSQIDDPVTRTRVQGIVDNLPDQMDGADLYRRMSKISRDADNQWTTPAGDRSVAEEMDTIYDALLDAFSAQLPPPVQAALKEAKEQWRLLRTLERGKTIDTDGMVNPQSLDSALRAKYVNEYAYGKGIGNAEINDVLEASRIAYRMRDIVGNSGTATRSADILSALTTAPADKAAAQAYLGTLTPGTAVKGAAGAGLGATGAAGVVGSGYGLLFGD